MHFSDFTLLTKT